MALAEGFPEDWSLNERSEVYTAYDNDLCGGERCGKERWTRIEWKDDHGRLYRDGGLPAVVHYNGNQEWVVHNVIHRDGNLPAFVRFDGYCEW